MTDWGNVAIGVRMGGPPHPRWVNAWQNLVWRGLRPGDMLMAPAIRMPAHRAANRIVHAFLNEEPLQGCDTLCFVDDDHVFGLDTLEKLRTNEDLAGFDVAGALYAARGPTDKANFPVILRRDGDKTFPSGHPKYQIPTHVPTRGVVPCDALGLGFTMIRRWVLEAVLGEYPSCFEYREPSTTEDVVFCERAIDAGAKLAVDAGLVIGHLMDLVVLPNRSEPEGD